ncbi:hypothetical protein ACM92K_000561 [Cronobacter turicensis]|uniref:hypothetical protein n=1 Tax=unclassified Cronobacter TaxID=2649764 RepID=UPI0013EC9A34|nr:MULTISPECIES: hypothetical protein [unclassified Cronobacter]ELQ6225175.1 hypothetical protein [Cronobacter turicensis]ELY4522102.1 hypothetical protein [Cronobacter turicensis]ELY5827161.1 hypothetical protein [Cronobacter turicensis]KAF6594611.1 hypothetical protein G9G39_10705 [Cronobacter sp. EKM101R]KAF6596875.1 hypothetical protein G9G38_12280 [Cronobacter sp. EKM102R]
MKKRNNALISSITLGINSNKEIVNQAIDVLVIISGDKLLAAKGKARNWLTRQRAQKRRGKKGKGMKS